MSDLTLPPGKIVYDFTVSARRPWSRVIKAGQRLRIIDLEGQQAVDTLFYNAHDTSERYSAQETVLDQSYAYIKEGTRLISNEGNILGIVTADTCGQHDTSAGACSCEANTVRFGHHTKYMESCREQFLTELARHGMDKRDLVSNINFFMNVPIAPSGELAIVDGMSAPGAYVEVEAEMDVLCLISNCPQVNNPCNGFNPTPIRVVVWEA